MEKETIFWTSKKKILVFYLEMLAIAVCIFSFNEINFCITAIFCGVYVFGMLMGSNLSKLSSSRPIDSVSFIY